MELWTDEDQDDNSDLEHSLPDPADNLDTQNDQYVLIQWFLQFLFHMQSIYHLADNVIDLFIRFCKAFFSLFGRLYSSCYEIGQAFPRILYSARTFLGFNKKSFRQYVVCKWCYSIYNLSECIEVRGSQQIPKDCPHVPFGGWAT